MSRLPGPLMDTVLNYLSDTIYPNHPLVCRVKAANNNVKNNREILKIVIILLIICKILFQNV